MSDPLQSLTRNLTAYYRAMFSDIAWLYHRPSGMGRDLSRLVHELGVRGSRVVTIDLPALCKHFDQCLDQGEYKPSRLAYGRVGKAVKVPVFMQDLYLLIFDSEGKLRPNPSSDAIAALRAIMLSTKKIRVPLDDKKVLTELKNFERIEHEVRTPTLCWSDNVLIDSDYDSSVRVQFADLLRIRSEPFRDDLFGVMGETLGTGRELSHRGSPWLEDRKLPLLLTTLQRVCDVVFSSLGDFGLLESSEMPKHGPGVTAEMGKWDDKFHFPTWPAKLEATYPYDFFGSPNLGDHVRSYGDEYPSEHEAPSRIIAVPKTQKAPRLIAAEPTSHQWIQQLIWNQLENRLEKSPISAAIHFRDQSHNQELSRIGSISGSHATIDLSSASDYLSCWTLERASRVNPSFLRGVHACRTRYVTYRRGQTQEYLTLKKFAPMGSACTFPVQTVVYACAAIASILFNKERAVTSLSIKSASHQISVFGDDLVVPTDTVGDLVDLLNLLGHRVNSSKTFYHGSFRESCGAEWWNGDDVSVPYMLNVPALGTHATMSSFIEVRNNFYKRGYWATARWLESWIRNLDRVPSAHPEKGSLSSSDPGLLSVTRKSRRLRFSKHLHRFEEYGYFPIQRRKTVSRAGWSSLMAYFTAASRRDCKRDGLTDHLGNDLVDTQQLTSNSSFWRMGWFPCHQAIPFFTVTPDKKTA